MSHVLYVLLLYIASPHVLAAIILDGYGDSPSKIQYLLDKYEKQIIDVEFIPRENVVKNSSRDIELHRKKRQTLLRQMKDDLGYLYVNINSIFYPADAHQYITLDVIHKDEPQRLKYLSHVSHPIKNPPHDLIAKMNEYLNIQYELMLNTSLGEKPIPCPVYHCILGFEHPKLKPYLNVFNEGAIKEKTFILQTLNNKDPQRRASAVFLMGHFQNPKEIIERLTPMVNDHSDQVRNNVMRVIADTIEHSDITEVSVEPFVQMLASPYPTDRNKALLVLIAIAKSNKQAQEIKTQAGQKLLTLLHMKQPNHHVNAYLLLKKISHKSYGEYQFDQWAQWLSQTI